MKDRGGKSVAVDSCFGFLCYSEFDSPKVFIHLNIQYRTPNNEHQSSVRGTSNVQAEHYLPTNFDFQNLPTARSVIQHTKLVSKAKNRDRRTKYVCPPSVGYKE